MKPLKEKIEVMQAALDGKEIEVSNTLSKHWEWFESEEPFWNWGDFDYRIKPEPMEFWANVYDDGYYVLVDHRSKLDNYTKNGLIKTIKLREVIE